jgi:molybdopterin synthase sulfur carrier subunit
VSHVRVVLPAHLRTLAEVTGEVTVDVSPPTAGNGMTIGDVLDAVEASFPVLVGAIRNPATSQRRVFVRFFACNEDLSHQPAHAEVPDAVQTGAEPFLVVGAMAGG